MCLAGCEFPAGVELFHGRDMWRTGMPDLNRLLALLTPQTPRENLFLIKQVLGKRLPNCEFVFVDYFQMFCAIMTSCAAVVAFMQCRSLSHYAVNLDYANCKSALSEEMDIVVLHAVINHQL